jgi:hypothetical protein
MKGNARYVANTPNEKDFSAGRAERAVVQYPIVAVLSCSDSGVAPELVFDQVLVTSSWSASPEISSMTTDSPVSNTP